MVRAGAPRVVSRPPDEMIKLGKEMVEWVIKNDPLHLSQWYTIHKEFMYHEWRTFIKCPEFLPYYEKALKLVGIKYLNGEDKRIKEGISQRWQRTYFGDLVEREDEDFQKDIDRKKQLIEFEMKLKASGIDENSETGQLFNSMMAQLSSMQAERAAAVPVLRNNSFRSKIKDSKS